MATPLDGRRLLSIAALGLAFMAHLAGRLWAWLSGQRAPGLATFTEGYRRDGIHFVSAEDRALAPSLGECTACRACDPVCPVLPAAASEGFVGPSRLILSNERLLPSAASAWRDAFLCIRCGACDAACPQGVPLDRMIGSMRRTVAAEAPASVPVELKDLVARAERHGHIAGDSPAAPRREDGAQHDHTYVPSCAASARDVAAETALLDAAGIDYGSAPSRCCGALGARGLGRPFAGLAEALASRKALHVVTADPRCYEHLRSSPLYADLVVRHVLELASELRVPPATAPHVPATAASAPRSSAGTSGAAIAAAAAATGAAIAAVAAAASGAASATSPPAAAAAQRTVTFHDPCQLARVPGGTELARDAIRRAGAPLVEMRRRGREAPCCGMGGGTFSFAPALAEELGRTRVREAAATGAAVLLTQSPLCRDHLARCAAKEGLALDVENVTELLAARIGAKLPPAPRPDVPSAARMPPAVDLKIQAQAPADRREQVPSATHAAQTESPLPEGEG